MFVRGGRGICSAPASSVTTSSTSRETPTARPAGRLLRGEGAVTVRAAFDASAICHPSRSRLRERQRRPRRHLEEQRMQFKAILVEKTDAGQSIALKELGLDAL